MCKNSTRTDSRHHFCARYYHISQNNVMKHTRRGIYESYHKRQGSQQGRGGCRSLSRYFTHRQNRFAPTAVPDGSPRTHGKAKISRSYAGNRPPVSVMALTGKSAGSVIKFCAESPLRSKSYHFYQNHGSIRAGDVIY